MNLVLLGAPGSGKGTQGEFLSAEFDLPVIATGDMLRAEVRAGTELGQQIENHLNSGELVPDQVVTGLIKRRLEAIDGGFIIDGYPRNRSQAEALGKILKELGKDLDQVIYLEVGEEELVKRLGDRRACDGCGSVYHLVHKPPRAEGVCDKCQGGLYQRDDDRPEAIRRRFEVYMNETRPLVSYYRDVGLLKVVDGSASVDAIRENLRWLLQADARNRGASV